MKGHVISEPRYQLDLSADELEMIIVGLHRSRNFSDPPDGPEYRAKIGQLVDEIGDLTRIAARLDAS